MATAIENSIASNVNRADKIRQHITQLGKDYDNTTPGQTVPDYTGIINRLNATISTLVGKKDNLTKTITIRQNLMKKSNTGINELLLRLKAGITAQYKPSSPVTRQAKALIDKYRAVRTEEPPKPELSNGTPVPVPKTKSEFQSGFDSKEGILKDIYNLVNKQTDYKSAHTDLSKANLEIALSSAVTANDNIFTAYKDVVGMLKERQHLYTILFYDSKYIKEYLKGKYGNEAPEYKTISSIQVSKLQFVPKEDPRGS